VGEWVLDDQAVLKELVDIVRETFLLWDDVWVGFSWKHYFFNHTQRVRALSLEMGRHEGADLRKLEYASLLHDITKRYDGNILRDNQGKRILDVNGFWRNELLLPNRENHVTRLYRKHNQFHELHNVSGALIARELLEAYGFSQDFSTSVSSIIEGHLKPDPLEGEALLNVLERKILYEADTIDANLGLIAFYRNIQIHTHSAILGGGVADLRQYVNRIGPWIRTKTPFVEKMATKSGVQIATERYRRMGEISSRIVEELENDYSQSVEYGMLGIIEYFMGCNQDPNLQDEMSYLLTNWIPQREKMVKTMTNPRTQQIFQNAVDFCELLSREIEGKA